jgi:hypothetical protein
MSDYTPPIDRDAFYKVYEEYAKHLRTWFVAYGVGGPVLILTQEKVSQVVVASGSGKGIALFFLAGVGLQVLLSLVNKWVNWGVYAYSETEQLIDGKRFAVCSWISEQSCLDVLFDLGTIVCFGVATWRIVALFT